MSFLSKMLPPDVVDMWNTCVQKDDEGSTTCSFPCVGRNVVLSVKASELVINPNERFVSSHRYDSVYHNPSQQDRDRVNRISDNSAYCSNSNCNVNYRRNYGSQSYTDLNNSHRPHPYDRDERNRPIGIDRSVGIGQAENEFHSHHRNAATNRPPYNSDMDRIYHPHQQAVGSQSQQAVGSQNRSQQTGSWYYALPRDGSSECISDNGGFRDFSSIQEQPQPQQEVQQCRRRRADVYPNSVDRFGSVYDDRRSDLHRSDFHQSNLHRQPDLGRLHRPGPLGRHQDSDQLIEMRLRHSLDQKQMNSPPQRPLLDNRQSMQRVRGAELFDRQMSTEISRSLAATPQAVRFSQAVHRLSPNRPIQSSNQLLASMDFRDSFDRSDTALEPTEEPTGLERPIGSSPALEVSGSNRRPGYEIMARRKWRDISSGKIQVENVWPSTVGAKSETAPAQPAPPAEPEELPTKLSRFPRPGKMQGNDMTAETEEGLEAKRGEGDKICESTDNDCEETLEGPNTDGFCTEGFCTEGFCTEGFCTDGAVTELDDNEVVVEGVVQKGFGDKVIETAENGLDVAREKMVGGVAMKSRFVRGTSGCSRMRSDSTPRRLRVENFAVVKTEVEEQNENRDLKTIWDLCYALNQSYRAEEEVSLRCFSSLVHDPDDDQTQEHRDKQSLLRINLSDCLRESKSLGVCERDVKRGDVLMVEEGAVGFGTSYHSIGVALAGKINKNLNKKRIGSVGMGSVGMGSAGMGSDFGLEEESEGSSVELVNTVDIISKCEKGNMRLWEILQNFERERELELRTNGHERSMSAHLMSWSRSTSTARSMTSFIDVYGRQRYRLVMGLWPHQIVHGCGIGVENISNSKLQKFNAFALFVNCYRIVISAEDMKKGTPLTFVKENLTIAPPLISVPRQFGPKDQTSELSPHDKLMNELVRLVREGLRDREREALRDEPSKGIISSLEGHNRSVTEIADLFRTAPMNPMKPNIRLHSVLRNRTCKSSPFRFSDSIRPSVSIPHSSKSPFGSKVDCYIDTHGESGLDLSGPVGSVSVEEAAEEGLELNSSLEKRDLTHLETTTDGDEASNCDFPLWEQSAEDRRINSSALPMMPSNDASNLETFRRTKNKQGSVIGEESIVEEDSVVLQYAHETGTISYRNKMAPNGRTASMAYVPSPTSDLKKTPEEESDFMSAIENGADDYEDPNESPFTHRALILQEHRENVETPKPLPVDAGRVASGVSSGYDRHHEEVRADDERVEEPAGELERLEMNLSKRIANAKFRGNFLGAFPDRESIEFFYGLLVSYSNWKSTAEISRILEYVTQVMKEIVPDKSHPCLDILFPQKKTDPDTEPNTEPRTQSSRRKNAAKEIVKEIVDKLPANEKEQLFTLIKNLDRQNQSGLNGSSLSVLIGFTGVGFGSEKSQSRQRSQLVERLTMIEKIVDAFEDFGRTLLLKPIKNVEDVISADGLERCGVALRSILNIRPHSLAEMRVFNSLFSLAVQ